VDSLDAVYKLHKAAGDGFKSVENELIVVSKTLGIRASMLEAIGVFSRSQSDEE
jgi:hypothetical protein